MKHVLLLLVLGASLAACKKNPAPPPPAPAVTTYIAGAIPNNDFTTKACYWKDSVLTPMGPSSPSPSQSYMATAIAQIGNTIYTCGYRTHTTNGENKIVFWANGEEYATDGHGLPVYPGIPNALFAAGNTLYMAGELQFSGQPLKAFYWVNKTTFQLEDVLKGASSVSGIYVADNKVYLSGYTSEEDDIPFPCYWLNKVRTMLPLPSGVLTAQATDIIVVDGVVHICGTGSSELGRTVPLYWKNGVLTNLALSGEGAQGIANSLDIFEGDVYIAGAKANTGSNAVACYWKNGQLTPLSKFEGGFGSTATSIKVTKGTVYVAGNADIRTVFYPCIWKNGIMSSPQLPASPGYTGIYGRASKMLLSK